ncbi:MAG: hypothetical protein RIS76_2491 [Verrucomicrobiota bacterium]
MLAAAGAALLLMTPLPAARAANANPPGQLTFQGFLTDGNGVPLGNAAPTNTPVIFQIFTDSIGGSPLWGSIQTVTVDKGHFSVLLGEGTGNGSDPFTADLSSLFSGADASDRFIQITVGTSAILPRLRFLSSPYALLARTATSIVKNGTEVFDGSTLNAERLSVTGEVTGPLKVSGELRVNSLVVTNGAVVGSLSTGGAVVAGSFSGNGAAVTAINGANISTGTISELRLPTLTGAGRVANSATTATSANAANTIVARDGAGSFTAANITALSNIQAPKINLGSAPVSANALGVQNGNVNLFASPTSFGTWVPSTDGQYYANFVAAVTDLFLMVTVTAPTPPGVAADNINCAIFAEISQNGIDFIRVGAASINSVHNDDWPIYANSFMIAVPQNYIYRLQYVAVAGNGTYKPNVSMMQVRFGK